jgi:iron complex transport system substrate-binding protein
MPCGFDLERTRQESQVLTRHPDWNNLEAVKQGKVFITDGNAYFNRPGPRLVDSLEILAEILHPDGFNFGHQGKAWQPLG